MATDLVSPSTGDRVLLAVLVGSLVVVVGAAATGVWLTVVGSLMNAAGMAYLLWFRKRSRTPLE